MTAPTDEPARAPKFCEDCRWLTSDLMTGQIRFARCTNPKNRLISGDALVARELVGTTKWRYEFCASQRLSDTGDSCGQSGKWFEPKEPQQAEAAE